MVRIYTFALALIAFGMGGEPAHADAYPVSGLWTYDNASDRGPAEYCGSRTMEFRGEQRFDTVGGISQYRNVSVNNAGAYQNSRDAFLLHASVSEKAAGRSEHCLMTSDR